jgi:hypothetical protein
MKATRLELGTAKNIYGTVHMPEGDFNTDPPYRVDIDGPRLTFYLPIRNVRFAGEINRVALRMGGLTSELRCPPVQVSLGDNLTILQPVEFDDLNPKATP